MIKKTHAFLLLISALALAGCTTLQPLQEKTESERTKKVRNVILVIGDGMGPQQLGLLLSYARQAPHSVIKNRTTAFDRMMNQGAVMGLSMTYAAGVLVTDSAAAGSQLASGTPAGSEMIGADKDGNPAVTILERAEKLGKSTGIISDTWLTHATPAVFAAHQPHRSQEDAIAVDMLNTGADVMLSGGLSHWIPKAANDENSAVHKKMVQMTEGAFPLQSKRKDERNLLVEARKKGYSLAFTKEQLAKAQGSKVLGLFSSSAMDDGIKANRKENDPARTMPSLREMTAKGLELLNQNQKGFFLMVEAGQIDWASHANDTGLLLQEMIKLNKTLEYILDWAANRDDTLLILTADHETGGFGFSYSGNDLHKPVSLPGTLFKDRTFQPGYNFGDPQVLDKLYRQQLSYKNIFLNFDALPASEQSPAKLAGLLNENTEFKITEAQATRILEKEENAYYVEGHKKLGLEEVPKIDVNDAFFVTNSKEARCNLLAIEVAEQQQAVWSTGAHTSTPVPVFAQGPMKSAFGKIMHHTELSRYATNALMNN